MRFARFFCAEIVLLMVMWCRYKKQILQLEGDREDIGQVNIAICGSIVIIVIAATTTNTTTTTTTT